MVPRTGHATSQEIKTPLPSLLIVRQGIQKGGMKWVFSKWGQTDVVYECCAREWASKSPTGCDEMPITAILNMAQRFCDRCFTGQRPTLKIRRRGVGLPRRGPLPLGARGPLQ
jgi:hypothetical protein